MAGGPTGVIGRGIQVKGSLSGSGDVIIQGRVEGQINLRDGVTVEDGGVVRADVEADSVIIHGEMAGNVDVHDRVRITNGAKLVGDIRAPTVILDDGARFNGSIEMEVKLPEGI
jgi:cytoskeletal protein CcmA (bactofilin family)